MFKFILLLFLSFSLHAINISPSEAETIGRGIFFNECGGKQEKLLWWNAGENFASLGIGHFIWYPEGISGVFEETFPQLLCFFKDNQVELPAWLSNAKHCPWKDKDAFLCSKEESIKQELQALMIKTIPLQTLFITKRLEEALPKILTSMSEKKKEHVSILLQQLQESSQGKFALIDYLNFKGDGTLITERYNGKGWGLKQVLEEMPTNAENPLHAFIKTAKSLLEERIKNAPKEKHEERWLKGWLLRVDRYHSLIDILPKSP